MCAATAGDGGSGLNEDVILRTTAAVLDPTGMETTAEVGFHWQELWQVGFYLESEQPRGGWS